MDHTRIAAESMAVDESLAYAAQPTVRFFQWTPAASLGWKQSLPLWLHPARWRACGLDVVERPTGGGLAFHGSDVSVSVVVPRTHETPIRFLMQAICQSAVRLCQSYGAQTSALMDVPAQARITYCALEPSPYAVIIKGGKLAGFALRRYPRSWLVQGSLLVRPVLKTLRTMLPVEIDATLDQRVIPLAVAIQSEVSDVEVGRRWAAHWAAWWQTHRAETLSVRV